MPNYLEVITDAELSALPSGHPIARVLGDSSQVSANTRQAAKSIARENRQWLVSLKPRLLDITDTANASSALGELRAYGSMLETAMRIAPGPTVTGKNVLPEFEVEHGDGPVIVEVHSRQLSSEQKEDIAQGLQELNERHEDNVQKAKAAGRSGNVVTTGIIPVVPFGAPTAGKPGDTVATNAISRVAAIKGKEHQVDPSKPFVLWLDLQDTSVWGLPASEEHFLPAWTEQKDGNVDVGVFWTALYARKGDPLLTMMGCDYASIPLVHEGRFNQTISGAPSRVSAYVFALPRVTVLMENPNAPCPLPANFRAALLKVPFFRMDLSLIEWEPGVVARQIVAQREAVAAAARALRAFNPP